MLPLRDRLPTRTFPFINYLLILANVAVYLWEGALKEAGYANVIFDFGFVPYLFNVQPVTSAPTVFTSMFMHGSLLHLGGNMLFLWIFGDNVEDAIGHFRYLAFYLLGGVAAAMTQLVAQPMSHVPMVGASGAIAAVLGAYLALYPTSPITVLNPVPFLWLFLPFIELPAWVVALVFFGMNLLEGFGSLATSRGAAGGVAFFAHVGGFVAGLALLQFFMLGRTRQQADRWSGWRPPPRKPPQDPWRSYDGGSRYR
jgi:membrane associated rhomboid family serine protease